MTRSLGLVAAIAVLFFGCGGDDASSSSTNAAGGDGGNTTTSNGGGGAGVGGNGGEGGVANTGGGGATGSPLGSVNEMQDCPLPPTAPAGAMCKQLQVTDCAGADDAGVQAMVYPPQGNERGTVVLGTGGPGTGFYDSAVATALAQAGFRTVNRAWDIPWETGPGGMAAAACRYATLVTWVSQRPWQQGPLCATGNSGGSSEISYALAHYGGEAVLDFAVPTAGPPMGRLDYGCLGDATWESTECPALFADTNCGNNNQCVYNANNRATIDLAYPGTPCEDADAGFAQDFLDDSVMSPTADVDYGTTGVHFVYGVDDCTIAVPLGLLHANAITSSVQIEWVSAPHAVFSTNAGRNAIVSALDTGCVP
jgi:hypothetical protein